ncbi:hypothetical protein AWM79_23425 [Pseudomonas agarici]|uniref:Secreted protein n=1 Tax=Pseudomonas agarici TaxID=46677 RepID=A0A0X1T7K4_PSEAA|nr:hypothetical protein [Pseudomonas agarici]AMB88066.1 hypothetical protein AWM79_23425 [Pseudomonas agarici]NWB92952.1 hypothetical protein [Pseudomonas agarici]NWC09219.1 hypothetical protein [Pseudomonas agarici]
MKNTIKFFAILISILPIFAHASDGADALQRFHEKNTATFAQQTEIEKHKQKESQIAEQEEKQAANANHPTDKQSAN